MVQHDPAREAWGRLVLYPCRLVGGIKRAVRAEDKVAKERKAKGERRKGFLNQMCPLLKSMLEETLLEKMI